LPNFKNKTKIISNYEFKTSDLATRLLY